MPERRSVGRSGHQRRRGCRDRRARPTVVRSTPRREPERAPRGRSVVDASVGALALLGLLVAGTLAIEPMVRELAAALGAFADPWGWRR